MPHINPAAWLLIGIAGWTILITAVLVWFHNADQTGEQWDTAIRDHFDGPRNIP